MRRSIEVNGSGKKRKEEKGPSIRAIFAPEFKSDDPQKKPANEL